MPAEPPPLIAPTRVPLKKRLGQIALLFVGSTATISALVNGAAAWWLIEPTDEQALGISRSQIVMACALVFVLGAFLIYLALRRWKR